MATARTLRGDAQKLIVTISIAGFVASGAVAAGSRDPGEAAPGVGSPAGVVLVAVTRTIGVGADGGILTMRGETLVRTPGVASRLQVRCTGASTLPVVATRQERTTRADTARGEDARCAAGTAPSSSSMTRAPARPKAGRRTPAGAAGTVLTLRRAVLGWGG